VTKDYTDPFTRADATSLGSPWNTTPSQMSIVSNTAKHTGTSNVMIAAYQQALDTADQSVSAKVVAVVGAFALIGRLAADGSNYYGFRRAGPDTISLTKVVAGAAFTSFVGPITGVIAAGDTMELRIVGNLIQGYINGVKAIEGTDSSIASGPYAGYRSHTTTTGNTIDDFRARDYVAAAGDTTAPSKVTPSVSGTTATTAVANWGAASDNVGVTGYRPFVTAGSTTVGGDLVQSTSYSFGGLTPDTGYSLSIRTYDAAGNYSDSDPVTFRTAKASDTVFPSKVAVTLGQTTSVSQAISWTQPTDNVAVGEVRVILSGGQVATKQPTELTHTFGQLNSGTAYSARIDVVDTSGNVTSSDVVNFTTSPANTGASWPDAFAYSDGNLPEPWTTVPAGALRVASGELTVATTTSSAGIVLKRALLTASQAASIKVVAVVSTFAVLCRMDDAFANYYGFRRSSSTTVSLFKVVGGSSWSDGILAQAAAEIPVGSRMEIRAVGNKVSGWVDGVKVIEATDDSIPSGLYGGFRATGNAQGARFDDFRAEDISAAAGDSTPPAAFSGAASNVTDSGFLFSWGEAVDNVGTVGYRVWVGALQKASLPSSARSYQFSGLTGSTSYPVRIEAFDAAGNTTSTSVATVQTLASASNPTATLQYLDTDGTVTTFNNVNFRTWDPIVGKEEGYFYGRTASYWDGASDTPITLADARPAFDKWKGKRAVFYGDSSGVLQTTAGVDYVTADLWPQLVAAGFATSSSGDPSNAAFVGGLGISTSSASFANRHGNSFQAEDVAVRMLNTGSSQWVPGSFDLVSVFVGGNNVGKNHDNEAGKLGYQNAWSSILGILRSASRVTTSVDTGTWAAHTTLFSGNARTSSTYGSSRTFTFTGTAGTLQLIALTSGGGSPFSYQIDGGPVITGRTTKGQAATTLLNGAHCPVPVHIRGLSAGSHTIKVTHTGVTGTDQLIVDAFLPWQSSESAMPFVLAFPPFYSTTAGWNNYPTPKPDNGDVDEYRRLFLDVLRQFDYAGNIGAVLGDLGDTLFPPTNATYRIADGLHPNKQGHKWIAFMASEMLRLFSPVSS
jgi:hypothetical protein